MNGIEHKKSINLSNLFNSKSSYLPKENKSFAKMMKVSQSHQTVQPNEANLKKVKSSDNQVNTKSLSDADEEKVNNVSSDINVSNTSDENKTDQMKQLTDKISQLNEAGKDKNEMDVLSDILAILQSIIQKQVESNDSIDEKSEANNAIEQLMNSQINNQKDFLQSLVELDPSNANNVGKNDVSALSSVLSSLLTKLESMSKGATGDKDKNLQIDEGELQKFVSLIGDFLEKKGVTKEVITKLTDSLVGIVPTSQKVFESKSLSYNNFDVDQKIDVKVNETSNKSFGDIEQNTQQLFLENNTKQFALFIGKQTNKLEANQFVRDFQNIIQKSAFTNEMGQQKIFIKLFPENLGRVSIELVKNEQGMTATIIASTAKAKELLNSQLDGLKQAFQINNLQVDKIDLYQSLQADRSSSYLNQEKDDQKQQQQQKQPKQSKDENENSSFLDEFMKVSL